MGILLWILVLSSWQLLSTGLIPSRARSVCHHLRKAGYHSVWSPASQDHVAGGHAGVGVVSLGGASLSLPSFVTPQFKEFFRFGRVLREPLFLLGKEEWFIFLLFMVIRGGGRCGSASAY